MYEEDVCVLHKCPGSGVSRLSRRVAGESGGEMYGYECDSFFGLVTS
jgi:hypothetical protein